MASTSTEEKVTTSWSEVSVVAEAIAARLRAAIPYVMELVVETASDTASLKLQFREF
jgi:hypothetical protein